MSRRKKTNAALKRDYLDTGTPELRNHHSVELVETATAGIRVARVVTQTPLDTYLNRGFIDQDLWQAGNRLKQDFYRAGLQPLQVVDLSQKLPGVQGGGGEGISDIRLEAHARFNRAANAIDRAYRLIVVSVCCYEQSVGNADELKRMSKSSRSAIGMYLLKKGLEALARHYGLIR